MLKFKRKFRRQRVDFFPKLLRFAITSALGWLTKGQRVVCRRIQKLKYRAASCPLSMALLLPHGRKLSSPSALTPKHEVCRLPHLDHPQYTLHSFVLNSAPSLSYFAFVILLFFSVLLLCFNRVLKYTRMLNCIFYFCIC